MVSVKIDASGSTPPVVEDSNDIPLTLTIGASDVIIAVIGPTGAGKTSFLNAATGHSVDVPHPDLKIGHNLESCTSTVTAVTYLHPRTGKRFVFVDTPGFDDTTYSDSDTLKKISDFLVATFRRRIHLSGILYICRISDYRMPGNILRNGKMFEQLCGPEALRNVALVTTMWDEVTLEEGELRESQLKHTYWKSMISSGSKVVRFSNTYDSAWNIIHGFSAPPQPLQLPTEIVVHRTPLPQTRAGRTLLQHFEQIIEKLRELIQTLEAKVRSLRRKGNLTEAQGVSRERALTEQHLEQVVLGHTALIETGGGPPLAPNITANLDDRTRPSPLDTHSRRISNGLAAAITTLRHLSSIGNIFPSPFSPFKGCVDLVITIAESVQRMNDIDDAFVELIHSSTMLVSAIEAQSKRGKVSEEVKQMINDLVKSLEEVKNLVEKIKMSRIGVENYLLSPLDIETIVKCNKRIERATQQFNILLGISIYQRLHKIQRNLRQRPHQQRTEANSVIDNESTTTSCSSILSSSLARQSQGDNTDS